MPTERSEAYRKVALALAQAGQIEQAQEAFQQALAAAERIEWADGRSQRRIMRWRWRWRWRRRGR
jgi:tetratricopeptide (TPR) repeat protein